MRRQFSFYCIVSSIVSVFILIGCNDIFQNKKSIKEGVITFNVIDNSSKSSTITPNQMTILFDGKNYRLSVTGTLNVFSLEHIKPYNQDSTFTLLRVMDQRVFFASPVSKGNFLFETLNKSNVVLIDGIEKNIMGYTCKKALLSMNENGYDPIEVYYTNEINIKNPNINTPFAKIPGVMLKFDIILNNIRYTFTATSIEEKKVEKENFQVNQRYQRISEQEMKDLINDLMN